MQKETILQVVDSMPDDVNLDELLNRLYVLAQIEEGERALVAEAGVAHDDVKRQFGL
jgi:hypothetical protein